MIEYLSTLENYLANDNLRKAFESFLEKLKTAQKRVPEISDEIAELKKQVILLSANFHDLDKQSHLSIIEPTQAYTSKNKVRFAFLDLLQNLKDYKKFYAFLLKEDEETLWLSAAHYDTKDNIQEYLEKYPNGKYKQEALHLLSELNKTGQGSTVTTKPAISSSGAKTDLEWWQKLTPPWREIFRNKIKFNNAPTENDFEKIKKIKKLNIQGNRDILSLEPIKNLKNLKFLNLSDTKIKSLQAVKELAGLEVLWFRYTPVNTLQPLKNLNKLIELDFDNTEVNDLTPISMLKKLEKLNCSLTNISSLYPIYDMPNLKVLNCETHLLNSEHIENFKLMNPNVIVNQYYSSTT